jgi:hypothetical protein
MGSVFLPTSQVLSTPSNFSITDATADRINVHNEGGANTPFFIIDAWIVSISSTNSASSRVALFSARSLTNRSMYAFSTAFLALVVAVGAFLVASTPTRFAPRISTEFSPQYRLTSP